MAKEMNTYLKLDDQKIEDIAHVLLSYMKGEISHQAAKETINNSYDQITGQEFALCEQYLDKHGVDDYELTERIEDVIAIVADVLVAEELTLEDGHPIHTYLLEVKAIRKVLEEIKEMKNEKFVKNKWIEIYDRLSQIKIHFSRKQNQLFSALEKKGFDKPTKIMWTLDDFVEKEIKTALKHLRNNDEARFLDKQDDVIAIVEDMMKKEEEVLYPTAVDMLSRADFIEMRKGDDEIGYALIDTPSPYGNLKTEENVANKELLKDLKDLLVKHKALETVEKGQELDVSQGRLTLEQINLIFKHMQVDLSYVDENEISKFYTDTKHRVFPRSPGVIGREVKNCHPKESVGMVEEIISAFRKGEQDEAEFWIDMGDKFIYIIYNAVRDEAGNFRGVLEMMQDATRIRGLEGSQRLLSWKNDQDKKGQGKEENDDLVKPNKYHITPETLIGDVVKEYPYIKDFLTTLSPKYEKITNPIIFKTMSKIATLEMISRRGDLKTSELIAKIVGRIDQ